MTRAVTISLVLGAVLLLAIPAAAATDIDRQQLADLAERARSNPAAFEELLGVTSVAGRPIDMGVVLDGPPAALAARLDVMTQLADTAAAAPSAEVQDTVRAILSRAEYDAADGVRGASLQSRLAELIFRYFPEPLARILTSGWFWLLAGLLAFGFVLSRVLRASRARARQFSAAAHGDASDRVGVTASDLETEAERAEGEGRLEDAVRLRFRAGLLRLGDAGAIRYSDSISTAAVRSRVESPDFDVVAGTFDRVHYGKLAADQADVAEARERWSRVLASVEGRHG